jgi:alkanesulfonate monooxygenase SsuD/methylene tetrahydromethanopterin reductase-like flavin-dependent oxidoreductase (luciferase family)
MKQQKSTWTSSTSTLIPIPLFQPFTNHSRLWEKSWEDGAQVWQEDPEMAYDPSKIHKINYEGKYFKMNASHQTHPSPQRTPLLFQAGSSKAGVAFGGRHAEAIFAANPTTYQRRSTLLL